MITKQQALDEKEFHAGSCMRFIGPRGGIFEDVTVWRRNGQTKLWKRSPNRFSVPIHFGAYVSAWAHSYITQETAYMYHVPSECPLNDPNFVTIDRRKNKVS